jgi:SIR2-like domain
MINEAILNQMAGSLIAGKYNLFLGSGVSLNSSNIQGALPGVGQLKNDLCKLKNVRESSSLQRVYSTLTPMERQTHVIDRFKSSQAGPTLMKLRDFNWRRVFSLNIDNALELAYAQPNSRQDVVPIHFNDDYSEERDIQKLQVIHLHGWVGRPDDEIVFSHAEYVRQMKSINPWMVLLTQFLPVEPFIIAGSSLEEVDLEFYLSHRKPSTVRTDRGPSILVEPNPDTATRGDCERYGLNLFHGTAEQFFDRLNQQFPKRPLPIELVTPSSRRLFPSGTGNKTILSFDADFEVVPALVTPSSGPTKFLYGNVPTWSDLEGNTDISREATSKFLDELETELRNGIISPKFYLISENTGTGKTTVLRRVGFELAKRGHKVISCSAISQIDSQLTAEAIDLIDDPLVILVDYADHGSGFEDTLLRASKKDILLIGAERDYRLKYIESISANEVISSDNALGMTNDEALSLVQKFNEMGLVGHRDAAAQPMRFASNIQHDSIAIACCRILNDFRPLDVIVRSLFKAANIGACERYIAISLAHFCFRGGVRYEILTSAFGNDVIDEQLKGNHALPVAYSDRGSDFLVPANSTLASRTLDMASKEATKQLLSVFLRLGKAIAPRVNRLAIKRRSPEAKLAGRLFDFDTVVKPLIGDFAEELYHEVQDEWRWNSRYWEQLALLNLSKFYEFKGTEDGQLRLRNAVQYARHAVSIEEHPLSLTTLGKVIFVELEEISYSDDSLIDEVFRRLARSIEIERRRLRQSGHPYLILFKGARNLLDAGKSLTLPQKQKLQELIAYVKTSFSSDQDLRIECGLISEKLQNE